MISNSADFSVYHIVGQDLLREPRRTIWVSCKTDDAPSETGLVGGFESGLPSLTSKMKLYLQELQYYIRNEFIQQDLEGHEHLLLGQSTVQ